MKEKDIYVDFGTKIIGARKDQYSAQTIHSMSELERVKKITKNKIWGKKTHQELLDEGREKIVVYVIKKVKDALPSKPIAFDEVSCCQYTDFIIRIREWLFSTYTINQMFVTLNKIKHECYVQDNSFGRNYVCRYDFFPYKDQKKLFQVVANVSDFSVVIWKREMMQKKFLSKTRTTSVNKNKITDKIPYLENIERVGMYYKDEITTADIQNEFGIKGGQFGNYENQKERKKNVDYSYFAFYDLSKSLSISPSDIGLHQTLSISYGARGRGGKNAAMAHYEPVHKIINLTKLKGAGSLAHEWGHALDHFLYEQFIHETTATSLMCGTYFLSCNKGICKEMDDLMESLYFNCSSKYKRTQFYEDARLLDYNFHRTKDYYCTKEEMFARAFACFVQDSLEELGYKNDYLCGHANALKIKKELLSRKGVNDNQDFVLGYPVGEERKIICSKFKTLFQVLKEKGIFANEQEKSFMGIVTEKNATSIKIESEDDFCVVSYPDLPTQQTKQLLLNLFVGDCIEIRVNVLGQIVTQILEIKNYDK